MKTIDATKQALQDAIKHADDIAGKEGCTECGREHKQLADWLRELFFKREEASKEKAIGSLRAAIAQPESEPVAWFNAKRDMTYLSNHYADDIPLYAAPVQTVKDDDADLLTIAYMAGTTSKKPAYVPLSDEQIKQIVIDACDQQFGTGGDIKFTDKDAEFYGIAFRAIEKAVRGEK